jgi:hypothetical protein
MSYDCLLEDALRRACETAIIPHEAASNEEWQEWQSSARVRERKERLVEFRACKVLKIIDRNLDVIDLARLTRFSNFKVALLKRDGARSVRKWASRCEKSAKFRDQEWRPPFVLY